MQALVFTGPGTVELLDVDEPVAGPDEAVVEVAASGICGSELHGAARPGYRQPPLVMGHEFAGTTLDGRRVVINPIVSCGDCDLCRDGHDHICRHRAVVGIQRPGAFAERVAVPERLLHELPARLTWTQGALVEPLANGLHAWEVAGRPKGTRVGVIGAGTIGLVCLMAASVDAEEVVVVDRAADRLDVAAQLGATTAAELVGEFDVVIDAVGVASTREASVRHIRPGGTAVWIGLASAESTFDATELVRLEKRVLGTFAYPDRIFAEAIERIDSCDLSWVHSFPLAEGASIFTQLMRGRSDVVKAVLEP